jgi:two-component system NtrC family sensor kinase
LASSSGTNVIRVLQVDDDHTILDVSKQILLDMGKFEIDSVTSVDDAIKKLSIERYDVVISDYKMSGKNGLDFLREIKEQQNDISFILFTGKGREEVAVEALNLGADSYINKNGSPETVYGELADALTKTVERNKSRKRLIESESKYRLLVEQSLQGIMIAQFSPFSILFANASMGRMLGYSPEELTSISSSEIGELIYYEDRAVFFERFRNRLEGKTAKGSHEFRAVRKDGSIAWMEAFATLIEYEGKPAVQTMFQDIDEHKKAQEILMKSEQRYRELANSLPEIIFETDTTGKIIFFNQRAYEITGFSPEELKKGISILSFVVPEQVEKVKESISNSMIGKNLGANEYLLLRKDGSTFPALVRTNPIISETKVKGMRGIVMDITDRKEMENKLEQYSKHLEELIETRTLELRKTQQQLVKSERLAAIGELAGIVGHDLHNPLTDISNAANLLREKSGTISKMQFEEAFETIEKCIFHSNKIINDLFDYSKEIYLKTQESSPRTLVLDALDFIHVPENVKIINNVPEIPIIKVDSERVTRVFINLIRNGIEAITKEGSITINCKNTQENIEISFTDTGSGITSDLLPKIFSPIVTNKAHGVGFGLAICKRIIDAHAGTFSIDTVEGKGTTFTVSLPIKFVSEAQCELKRINQTVIENSIHDCVGLFNCSEPGKCSDYRKCLKKYLQAENRNDNFKL